MQKASILRTVLVYQYTNPKVLFFFELLLFTKNTRRVEIISFFAFCPRALEKHFSRLSFLPFNNLFPFALRDRQPTSVAEWANISPDSFSSVTAPWTASFHNQLRRQSMFWLGVKLFFPIITGSL